MAAPFVISGLLYMNCIDSHSFNLQTELLDESELFALFEFSVSCEHIRIVISKGA
jgi:hypothetical protein